MEHDLLWHIQAAAILAGIANTLSLPISLYLSHLGLTDFLKNPPLLCSHWCVLAATGLFISSSVLHPSLSSSSLSSLALWVLTRLDQSDKCGIYPPVCLSLSLFLSLSLCLSVCLPACSSICLLACPHQSLGVQDI